MAYHFYSYYHAYEQAIEDYEDVLTQTGLLDTRIGQMASEAQQDDWGDAFVYCAEALRRVSYALKLLIGHIDFPANYPPVIDAIYYNRFAIDHITVTFGLDEILMAMAEATPTQVKEFIGYIDAYRVGIWDAPFDWSFYAKMAREFKQWP